METSRKPKLQYRGSPPSKIYGTWKEIVLFEICTSWVVHWLNSTSTNLQIINSTNTNFTTLALKIIQMELVIVDIVLMGDLLYVDMISLHFSLSCNPHWITWGNRILWISHRILQSNGLLVAYSQIPWRSDWNNNLTFWCPTWC